MLVPQEEPHLEAWPVGSLVSQAGLWRRRAVKQQTRTCHQPLSSVARISCSWYIICVILFMCVCCVFVHLYAMFRFVENMRTSIWLGDIVETMSWLPLLRPVPATGGNVCAMVSCLPAVGGIGMNATDIIGGKRKHVDGRGGNAQKRGRRTAGPWQSPKTSSNFGLEDGVNVLPTIGGKLLASGSTRVLPAIGGKRELGRSKRITSEFRFGGCSVFTEHWRRNAGHWQHEGRHDQHWARSTCSSRSRSNASDCHDLAGHWCQVAGH